MAIRQAYGTNGLVHDCAVVYERVLGGCIHCPSGVAFKVSIEIISVLTFFILQFIDSPFLHFFYT